MKNLVLILFLCSFVFLSCRDIKQDVTIGINVGYNAQFKVKNLTTNDSVSSSMVTINGSDKLIVNDNDSLLLILTNTNPDLLLNVKFTIDTISTYINQPPYILGYKVNGLDKGEHEVQCFSQPQNFDQNSPEAIKKGGVWLIVK